MRSGPRWVLFGVAVVLGLIGNQIVSQGLAASARAGSGAGELGGWSIAAAGVALIAGAWTLGMVARPVATVVVSLPWAMLLALFSIGLGVAAYVLPKTNLTQLDSDRAARSAWLGAATCAAMAVGLGLNAQRYLRRTDDHEPVRRVLVALAVGYSALLFLGGLGLALLAVINMVQVRGLGFVSRNHLNSAVFAAGTAVLYVFAGGCLLWHGAAAYSGVAAQRFRPWPVWLPLGWAAMAIASGYLLIQTQTAVGLVPIAHAVAVLAPGLTILALAARAGRRVSARAGSTWREITFMVAYGIAIAATIAALVNSLALIGALTVRLAADGAFDGSQSVGDFRDALNHAADFIGGNERTGLLLIVIALIGPLNEEFWKSFGVRVLRSHHPSRYQAFLWGLASGVGFGMVEANEYGLGALVQSPYRWWDGVLLRGGASCLHALASGTAGIAWFYLFAGRRLRFVGLFLTAVGLHGSWNALNVLTAERVLPGFRNLSDHDLEIILEIVIGIIAAFLVLLLWRLSVSLAAEDGPRPEAPSHPPDAPVAPTAVVAGG